MEVVQVRNSLVNGEKAYHQGEWDGAISSHWNSSKMILKPFERDNKISKIFITLFITVSSSTYPIKKLILTSLIVISLIMIITKA